MNGCMRDPQKVISSTMAHPSKSEMPFFSLFTFPDVSAKVSVGCPFICQIHFHGACLLCPTIFCNQALALGVLLLFVPAFPHPPVLRSKIKSPRPSGCFASCTACPGRWPHQLRCCSPRPHPAFSATFAFRLSLVPLLCMFPLPHSCRT